MGGREREREGSKLKMLVGELGTLGLRRCLGRGTRYSRPAALLGAIGAREREGDREREREREREQQGVEVESMKFEQKKHEKGLFQNFETIVALGN